MWELDVYYHKPNIIKRLISLQSNGQRVRNKVVKVGEHNVDLRKIHYSCRWCYCICKWLEENRMDGQIGA